MTQTTDAESHGQIARRNELLLHAHIAFTRLIQQDCIPYCIFAISLDILFRNRRDAPGVSEK